MWEGVSLIGAAITRICLKLTKVDSITGNSLLKFCIIVLVETEDSLLISLFFFRAVHNPHE